MLLKSIASLIIASTFAVWSSAAISHDPENNPGKPVHGGQYVEYEQHNGIELITTKSQLIFHITEHLQPRDMTGSAFKAFVQTKTGTQILAVSSDGAKLIVDLNSALPKNAKIVLTGKDEDGHILQARFVTD